MKKITTILIAAMIVGSFLMIVNVNGNGQPAPPGPVPIDVPSREHAACSNAIEPWMIDTRSGPPDKPSPPGPPEREPIEREPTTTTTTPPTNPPSYKSPSGVIISSEVKSECETDQECQSGLICCAGLCKNPSTGVCRDINGDRSLDWVPYSSAVLGDILGNILNWLFGRRI